MENLFLSRCGVLVVNLMFFRLWEILFMASASILLCSVVTMFVSSSVWVCSSSWNAYSMVVRRDNDEVCYC